MSINKKCRLGKSSVYLYVQKHDDFLCVFVTGGAELSDVSQPVSVRTLKLGESATIECVLKSIIDKRVWCKLTAERRLQVVATYSSRYKWIVVDELKHRYSVNSNNHLTISAASWDDAGTYFCGVLRVDDIEFGSGTLLMLQGIQSILISI